MKSPAFQWYPTDYLGSQRVQMMTLEEEGAYCRLLWSCWQHGSIPSEPELAARLVGKGCSTTVAKTVLLMFTPSEDPTRLLHDRLELERQKQASWRAKSAAGGRKSSEVRKGGSTTLQPPFNHPANQMATLLLQSSVSTLQSSASDPQSHSPKKEVRFAPPSQDEVEAECVAKGMPKGEAGKFMGFYGSKGWMVGKNKMVSWPHALAGWKARMLKDSPRPEPKQIQEHVPVKLI